MNNDYDVVVVGGGLAGLTSAAYLCRYGYRTMLCEKSDKTGGLVNTFWHRGFAFDAGIRAFENSGIIFPMLKSLGIDIPFRRNAVSIGIGNEWTRLESRRSLDDYAAMLCALFPEDAADVRRTVVEIEKVMQYMDVLYGIDNPLFLDNMMDREYLMKTLLPWLLKYQVNIRKAARLSEPIYRYLSRISDNRALIDMIAQHFFAETPAFFALSYFGLYLDYSYPAGGTGVLAEKVATYILKNKGEIRTQTPVVEVDAQLRRVTTASGDEYRYKKLVWAADQKALYATLEKPGAAGIEKQRVLAEQGSSGDSILTLFMGVSLDLGYFEAVCGAHAFYTPVREGLSSLPRWEEAAREGEEALRRWLDLYLKRTTYEISCPVVRDASLAPEGKTGVIVSTLMDYRLVKHISDAGWYEAFKEMCSAKILEVLDTSVFPGIRLSTEFTLCATPLTIERETGNAQGAITGWAFTNYPIPAENRFQKIAKSIRTPIQDVYQCGQWVFSPSGLPVSILTGKLAADAVNKHLGKGALA